uniref:Uncharacterized protein n=1 Tax=Pseudomonas phage HRDY3 TaxID=3236930 RepID=A0AB39CDH5_9VIRU
MENKYENAIKEMEERKLRVCFLDRTISHPGFTMYWAWGRNGLTFLEALSQAIADMDA